LREGQATTASSSPATQSYAGLIKPAWNGTPSHREADAECLRRELQWNLREELLNETLFTSMAQARVALGSSLKNADMGNA
jgi:hypothetical protein